MKTINTYITEKLHLKKGIETSLTQKEFIDYIKSDLGGDILDIGTKDETVHLVHLKDYDNLCDSGYPCPRVDLEFDRNFFRFYGEEEYWNNEGELESMDTNKLETEKHKGEYKYSMKNAEQIIKTLKDASHK